MGQRVASAPIQLSYNSAMKKQRSKKLLWIAAGVLLLVGIILLIVGIVLLVQSNEAMERCSSTVASQASDKCGYSDEAVRSGFDEFLQEVQDSFYGTHPEDVIYKSGVTVEEVKKTFKAYDPSPLNIKKITDKAASLLDKLNAKTINVNNLKPREKKALFQVKYFLQFNYGVFYSGDYYAGDFLLGPDNYCWHPICYVNYQMKMALRYYKPKQITDIFVLRDKMAEFNRTFVHYMENTKYGVLAGMVRSIKQCQAGLDTTKRLFFQIALKGPKGVYDEPALQSVLSDQFLSLVINKTEEMKEWETKYGKTYNETLREYVLTYIGEPVHKLYRYLEYEHAQYCVPSNISSGLASLPLSYIYINGTNTGQATTKKLPTGEPLDGKKAYEKLLPFFTTTDQTPDEVHDLGYKMLNKLYPEVNEQSDRWTEGDDLKYSEREKYFPLQVLEIARQVTGQSDNDTAKEQFIIRLNQSDMFFVSEPIPQNESDTNAHNLCSNIADAKRYCPVRWAAMQRWFEEARMVMSMLDPKTTNLFHFSGSKHTTPNCPVKMSPDFNPASGVQSYQNSNFNCTKPAIYNIPFFNSRPGPKYEEWSVNAHEARPGHHTQVQGLVEHFQDSCGGLIGWIDKISLNAAFVEGWALYAENPLIARDTDTYENELFQKYGMLKWQVWRALRLIVDTGLHYKGFSRQTSLQLFAQYAWDTSDTAQQEVTRYQSQPGQATAYMIGQLHIMSLRDYAKQKLKDKFSLKDFHFHLLSQGSAPLSYLKDNIYKYVECTMNQGEGEGCQDVVDPVAKEPGTSTQQQCIVDDMDWAHDPPRRPLPKHYI